MTASRPVFNELSRKSCRHPAPDGTWAAEARPIAAAGRRKCYRLNVPEDLNFFSPVAATECTHCSPALRPCLRLWEQGRCPTQARTGCCRLDKTQLEGLLLTRLMMHLDRGLFAGRVLVVVHLRI